MKLRIAKTTYYSAAHKSKLMLECTVSALRNFYKIFTPKIYSGLLSYALYIKNSYSGHTEAVQMLFNPQVRI
jgi:hypothetical protein